MVGTRTGTARGDRRVRASLVFAESLLAAVLIVAALLAITSARRLANADPGFDPTSQITFDVQVPGTNRASGSEVASYFEQVAERTSRIPGVLASAASWALPLGGGGMYLGRSVVAFGDSPDSPNREVSVQWNIVTPGYWRASGIPLIRGRDFTVADDSAGAPVIIVNRAFATKMFGDSSALGRRILSSRDERVWREIVGVVGDVRVYGLDGGPLPGVYVPHRQDPASGMTLTVRTAGNPAALAPALRAAVREFDPNAAAANIRTMVEVRERSMARFISMSVLATAFGALALALAGIGIFGVVSYTVARRVQEVGIRMALGARPARVVWLLVRQASVPAVSGVLAGLAVALWLGQMLEPLLYQTTAREPAILIGAGAGLGLVTLLAAHLPARRAARVDPTRALRAM
jgi:predicted permease